MCRVCVALVGKGVVCPMEPQHQAAEEIMNSLMWVWAVEGQICLSRCRFMSSDDHRAGWLGSVGPCCVAVEWRCWSLAPHLHWSCVEGQP